MTVTSAAARASPAGAPSRTDCTLRPSAPRPTGSSIELLRRGVRVVPGPRRRSSIGLRRWLLWRAAAASAGAPRRSAARPPALVLAARLGGAAAGAAGRCLWLLRRDGRRWRGLLGRGRGFDADGRRRGGSGSRSGFAASLSVSEGLLVRAALVRRQRRGRGRRRPRGRRRLRPGRRILGRRQLGRRLRLLRLQRLLRLRRSCSSVSWEKSSPVMLLGEGAATGAGGVGRGAASAFGKKLGLFGCRRAAAASGFGGASAFSGDGRLGAGAFAFF